MCIHCLPPTLHPISHPVSFSGAVSAEWNDLPLMTPPPSLLVAGGVKKKKKKKQREGEA